MPTWSMVVAEEANDMHLLDPGSCLWHCCLGSLCATLGIVSHAAERSQHGPYLLPTHSVP